MTNFLEPKSLQTIKEALLNGKTPIISFGEKGAVIFARDKETGVLRIAVCSPHGDETQKERLQEVGRMIMGKLINPDGTKAETIEVISMPEPQTPHEERTLRDIMTFKGEFPASLRSKEK